MILYIDTMHEQLSKLKMEKQQYIPYKHTICRNCDKVLMENEVIEHMIATKHRFYEGEYGFQWLSGILGQINVCPILYLQIKKVA